MGLANPVVRRSNQQTLGCEMSRANFIMAPICKNWVRKIVLITRKGYLECFSNFTYPSLLYSTLQKSNSPVRKSSIFLTQLSHLETLFFIKSHKYSWCISKSGSRQKFCLQRTKFPSYILFCCCLESLWMQGWELPDTIWHCYKEEKEKSTW